MDSSRFARYVLCMMLSIFFFSWNFHGNNILWKKRTENRCDHLFFGIKLKAHESCSIPQHSAIAAIVWEVAIAATCHLPYTKCQVDELKPIFGKRFFTRISPELLMISIDWIFWLANVMNVVWREVTNKKKSAFTKVQRNMIYLRRWPWEHGKNSFDKIFVRCYMPTESDVKFWNIRIEAMPKIWLNAKLWGEWKFKHLLYTAVLAT